MSSDTELAGTAPAGFLDEVRRSLRERLRQNQAVLVSEREEVRTLLEAAELLGETEVAARLYCWWQGKETRLQRAADLLRERLDGIETSPARLAVAAVEDAAASGEPASPLDGEVEEAPAVAAEERAREPAAEPEYVAPVDAASPAAAATGEPAGASAGQPALDVGPPTEVESPPPSWEPMSKADLEGERKAIRDEVSRIQHDDLIELARFKSAAARFRAAQLHRRRSPGAQTAWKSLETMIRRKAADLFQDRYILPLTGAELDDPHQWMQLADDYWLLAQAEDALAWTQVESEAEGDDWWSKTCNSLLESIAAAQLRLRQRISKYFPGQVDPQQNDLYTLLHDLAERHSVFIRCLSPNNAARVELDNRAARLSEHFTSTKESVERRRRKREALKRWKELVEDPAWRALDDYDEETANRALECLSAGVPPSSKELRDPLIWKDWLIEGDDRATLPLLRQAVLTEEERLRQKAHAATAEEIDLPASDIDQAQLAEVLPHTRGRRAVMIGGQPHPENVRRLKELLELEQFDWPEIDEDDSPQEMVKAAAGYDLVFINRFNRRKSREVFHEYTDRLIVVPTGYGRNQVLRRVWETLCRKR